MLSFIALPLRLHQIREHAEEHLFAEGTVWCENMQIFFCTHYLYQNAKFSENETQGNCELRETNNDQGYIYEHTFSFETKLYTISLPFAAWDVQCSLVRLYQQTNMSLLQ